MEIVSVVMACYNAEKTVKRAIESVMNQSYKNFILYVMNDGSTDTSGAIIQQLQKQYPEQLILFHQENQGQTKAKNYLLQQVKGEYIAFIDSDDLWQREKLKKQVEVFLRHQKVGLCYSDGYYIDEKDNITGNIGIQSNLQGSCLTEIIMGNAIVASSVMIRKKLIDKLGGFDEDLSACENWELWIRIAQFCEFFGMTERLVCYRRHLHNMSLNFTKLRDNRLKVIDKNFHRFLEHVPNIQAMCNEAKFKTYHLFAESNLWHLRLKEARSDIREALKLRPWSYHCYKLYLKTLLGRQLLQKLRILRSLPFANEIA